MNKIFAPFLPPWVETGLQPAFYDMESGTVLQQTARMYAKVQQLTRLFNELSEETRTTVEEYIAKFDELEGKFIELKDFVEDYFDNLDVQEEIDHKLDEMVEDGTLQEIIINYLQTQAMLVFDTVADMKLATNLVDGSYVRTLGFYSAGDDGGAIYKISDTGTANEKNVIAVGNLYATLVYGKNINVKQFGAKGDGIQDDTDYIQAALDALVNNGSLYFPKGYNFLTTDTLTLSANDVCLYSEPKTEYSTSITCVTANKTIMNITGYGVTIKNLAFYGDGDHDNFATIDGLNFDRTPLGDDETYSNIDCSVEDCLFIHLDSCVTVKGRNARIKNNTFTESKKGFVGLLHKYSSETETSDFRGIYIVENVFHSMNNQDNSLTGKTLATMDSFCILTPLESNKVGNIQILNNKAEFCRSLFYKGYLPDAKISGNQSFDSFATLVYSPVEDASLANHATQRIAQITDNCWRTSFVGAYYTNFIVIKNCSNTQITGNSFRNCSGDAIVSEASSRLVVNNNEILQYGTATQNHSAILVNGGGSSLFASNNVIASMSYGDYGITASDSDVHLNNNNISVVTKAINVPATHIKTAEGSSPAWETPTLLNGFTLNSEYTKGYRKLENGKVEVQIALQNGTDNSNAFSLPEGYRPSRTFVLPQITLNPDANTRAYARFNTSGDVRINWGGDTPQSSQSYIINVIFD